jgi:hypothetical protein
MRAGRQLISRAERTPTGAAGTKHEPFPVNVRVKISALWASTLFIFAYVDLFSLYRPDFRADVETGEVAGFAVNQTFLLGTTAYVVIPSLMIFCVLSCGRGSTDRQHRPGHPLCGQHRRCSHR